jgi:hypothetical protein
MKQVPEHNTPLTFNNISNYFDRPLATAALELGVSETFLKRRCRALKIPRWPYRSIVALQNKKKEIDEENPKEGFEIDQEIDKIVKTGVYTKSPKKTRTTRSKTISFITVQSSVFEAKIERKKQGDETRQKKKLDHALPLNLSLDVNALLQELQRPC